MLDDDVVETTGEILPLILVETVVDSDRWTDGLVDLFGRELMLMINIGNGIFEDWRVSLVCLRLGDVILIE